jgi:hypothetical protein
MDPKKIYKDPQVGRMYGPLSELKNKPLTKSLGPFLLGETIQNNQKTGFFYCFFAILGSFGHPQMDPKRYKKAVFGHFGAIWATPNGPKNISKGPPVGRMYGPMSKR